MLRNLVLSLIVLIYLIYHVEKLQIHVKNIKNMIFISVGLQTIYNFTFINKKFFFKFSPLFITKLEFYDILGILLDYFKTVSIYFWLQKCFILCGENRFSGVHCHFFSCLVYLLLVASSGNPIWICWGRRPQWLRDPGHTLIPADLRGFFFSVPRFSKSWKPCPARCLETRLLPVSHPAVASGDRISWLRLELNLECFRTPEEEKKNTISHGNQITPPLLLLHMHTLLLWC